MSFQDLDFVQAELDSESTKSIVTPVFLALSWFPFSLFLLAHFSHVIFIDMTTSGQCCIRCNIVSCLIWVLVRYNILRRALLRIYVLSEFAIMTSRHITLFLFHTFDRLVLLDPSSMLPKICIVIKKVPWDIQCRLCCSFDFWLRGLALRGYQILGKLSQWLLEIQISSRSWLFIVELICVCYILLFNENHTSGKYVTFLEPSYTICTWCSNHPLYSLVWMWGLRRYFWPRKTHLFGEMATTLYTS